MNVLLNVIALTIFLGVSLVISLFAARGIKSMREYAQANKSLGLGALIATLIATLIEAKDINIKSPYKGGIISILPPISLMIMVLLLGIFIFPRLTVFKDEMTLAGVMHTMYGPVAKYTTVIVSTLFSLLFIEVQFITIGHLGLFIDLSPKWIMLLMGLFITLYTSIGGIRAVTKTDIWQLLVVVIGFIVFFFMVLSQFNGLTSILAAVPKKRHFSFFAYPTFIARFNNAFFWSIFPTMLIAPPVIQRVLMTEKKKDIRSMFASFAVFYPFFRLLLLIVGFAFFSVGKSVSMKSHFDKLIPLLCKNQLGQMCFVLAVCGVCMSTIDSFLNALSIMLVHDVIEPIATRWYKKKKMNTILMVRLVSLLIGIVCTLATLIETVNLRPSDIAGYAFMILSILVIPFFIGVIGFKGSIKVFMATILSFLLTMGIGFVLYMQEEFSTQQFLDSCVSYLIRKGSVGKIPDTMRIIWLFAVFISTLTFFIAHAIQHGKFLLVDREQGTWRERRSYNVLAPLAWLIHPVRTTQEKAVKYGITPYLFALFAFILFMTPPLSSSHAPENFYFTIALVRGIGLLLCGVLMAQTIWPTVVQPFFALTYYLTVLFCIPFVGTLTALLDPQSMMVVPSIIIGMIVLAVLVDWSSFLLLETLGVAGALLTNKAMGNPFFPALGEHVGVMLWVSIGFTLLALSLFLRQREGKQLQRMEVLQDKRFNQDNMLRTYAHTQKQLTDILHQKSSMMTVVRDTTSALRLEGADPKKLEAIDDAMQYFYSAAALSKGFLSMAPQKVALDRFLDGVLQRLRGLGVNPADDGIVLTQETKVKEVCWDVAYIENLVVNSIVYMMKKAPKTKIQLGITDTTLDYEVPNGYRKDLSAGLRLVLTTAAELPPPSKDTYHPFRQEALWVDFHNLPMLENVRILQAHYGVIRLEENLPTITHSYVVPTDIKGVRPNIKQFAKEDLSDQTKLDDPRDKAFLKTVAEKGLPLKIITKALKIAKHYHYGAFRKSGEPFYSHPLAVASILLKQHTQNIDLIIAALLHDTLEDTEYTRHQMRAMFGDKVTRMVLDVTHLYSKSQRPKIKLGKSNTLDKLIESGGSEALLIKLIDRLHNMRTLGAKSKQRQKAIAQETLEVFIPIAQKLGIPSVEDELKRLAQQYLQ